MSFRFDQANKKISVICTLKKHFLETSRQNLDHFGPVSVRFCVSKCSLKKSKAEIFQKIRTHQRLSVAPCFDGLDQFCLNCAASSSQLHYFTAF